MTTSENLKPHVSIVLSLSAIKGYKYVCAELNSLVLSEIDAECGLSEWTQCVPAVSPTLRGHHQAWPHGWHLSRTPKWLPALWPGL